jgi:hypothetical protein
MFGLRRCVVFGLNNDTCSTAERGARHPCHPFLAPLSIFQIRLLDFYFKSAKYLDTTAPHETTTCDISLIDTVATRTGAMGDSQMPSGFEVCACAVFITWLLRQEMQPK